MDYDSRLAELRELLAAAPKAYEGVRIRCIAERNGETLENLWLQAVFIPRGSHPIVGERHSYERLMLIERWLPVPELLDVIAQAARGHVRLDDFAIGFSSPTKDQYVSDRLPSLRTFDRPTHVVQFFFETKRVDFFGRLLRPGAPYFPTVGSAIRNWCGATDYRDGQDARAGGIQVLFPESRSHFGSFDHRDGALRIELAGEPSFIAESIVKGAYWTSSGIHQLEEQAADGTITLPVAHDADALELFLLHDGTILDSHDERPGASSPRGSVLRPAQRPGLDNDIEKALLGGESDTVEFKPYVAGGDNKMLEICDSVAAFANTAGGIVLIGVDDQCVVVGIERDLAKAGVPFDEAEARYRGVLSQAIGATLNKKPPVSIETRQVRGHTIAVIVVAKGHERPYYALNTKRVLVRRSASNRMADPEHELPALIGSADGDVR